MKKVFFSLICLDIGQRIDKFGRRREKILFVANRFLIRRIGFERRAAVEEYDAHVFLRQIGRAHV